jgi:hypothetical protein
LDNGANINNVYDLLFEKYVEKGGGKNYEKFKDRIQNDVLLLVRREVNKKKCHINK